MRELLKEFNGLVCTTKVRSAAINRKTGVLYINPLKFFTLSPTHQKFLLYHELGHFVQNTKSEILADRYAMERFFREGGALSDALKAMSKILSENNKAHQIRMNAIYKYAKEFDKKHYNSFHKLNQKQRLMSLAAEKDRLQTELERALELGDKDLAEDIFKDLLTFIPEEQKLEYTKRMAQIFDLADAARAEGDYFNSADGEDDDDYAEGEDDDDYAEGEMIYAEGFADAMSYAEDLVKMDKMPTFPNTAKGRKDKASWLKAQKENVKAYAKKANADAKIKRAGRKGFGESLGDILGKGGDFLGKLGLGKGKNKRSASDEGEAAAANDGGGGGGTTPEKDNKMMYIIIAVIVLILVIGGIVWYKKSGSAA